MPLDQDLGYAVEAMVLWGVHLDKWRGQQQRALQRVLAELQPIREALEPFRSETSKAVATQRDIAGIALFTALLRWPDRTQALGYLQGFDVVGEIPTSRVFRPISVHTLQDDFFGPVAEAEVQQALRAPAPKFAEAIHRLTLEEVEKASLSLCALPVT